MLVIEIVIKTGLEMSKDDEPKPYKLAQLRKHKDRWLVVFSAYDHEKKALKEKQLRVPTSLNEKQRTVWAKEKIQAINKLLALGYSFNAKKARKAEGGKDAGKAIEGSPTVKAAFNEMLSLVEASMRPETLKSYKTCFKSFLAFAASKKLEKLPVSSLEPRHIIAYLDGMELEGKSAYTFNGHLNM